MNGLRRRGGDRDKTGKEGNWNWKTEAQAKVRRTTEVCPSQCSASAVWLQLQLQSQSRWCSVIEMMAHTASARGTEEMELEPEPDGSQARTKENNRTG